MPRAPKNQDSTLTLTSNRSSVGKRNSIGNDFEEQFHEERGTQIIDDIYIPPPPLQPQNLDDQTGERLIIETIGITNFKSFGGYTLLGPFYKSFNSIVGPNGSGKSNVIDSMLFVFGYRAHKLRCTKISSIIHNSESMPNCQFAQVDVNFAMIDDKGDDNVDVIDGSRFTVSRVVNKDNSSHYMIDNRRMQFRDVSKKLQEVGIDLRYNRFLILQGEVEQISLMKPKADPNSDVGMLEYLEDIIGTSRYKEPIDKLAVKYNELNEQRTQYVVRANYAQNELKSFEKSKNEAIQALVLENKKKIEKAKLVQYHQYRLSKKLQHHEEEYAIFEQKFNDFNKEEETIGLEKAKFDEEEKTKSIEFTELEKNAEKLKLKFQECNKNDLYYNQRMKSTKDKLKKLKNKIIEDQKKLAEWTDMPSQNDELIEKLEQSKIEMETELKQIEEKMNEETSIAQKACSELIKQRDQLNLESIKFKDMQSSKLDQMNEAYNQFMVYKQQADSTKDKYEQLQTKFRHIHDETDEKNRMLEKYQQEIPVDQAKLKKFQSQLKTLEQKRKDLTEIIEHKASELLNLRRSIHNVKSNDATREALMDAKHKGILDGIYGRLGNLGAIDKEYDVAVSTACGRLKNFVVDTIDNAQKCVEFLKQQKLSSATFIALDKLRVQWQPSISYPENVPRLVDLIRINDDRIRPAFYYALGETLVAKDIDQARRITQQKRYRVVTLKGDMIEMDGAMTGGGQPRSGGMGQSIAETGPDVSEDQMIKLAKEIESLQMERQQLDIEIDGVHDSITKLERDLKFMEEKANSFRLDIQESANRLKQVQENIERQKIEVEKLKNNPKLDEAEQLYLKAKQVYDKSMTEMNSLLEQVKDLDNLINEKIDERMGPLKKRRKTLEKNMKENQTQLNQLVSEKTSAELNLKKAEEAIANNLKSQEETEQEMEEIKKQIAEIEIVAKEITEKYENAQQECLTKEKELNDLRTRAREMDAKFNSIKNSKLDLKLEAEEKFKVLKDKREKMARYRAELESIKLDPIDDDEDDPQPMETDQEPMEIDQESEITQTNGVSDSSGGEKPKKKYHMTIPILSDEELEELSFDMIEKNIKSIESELGNLSPNFAAIEIFRKHRRDYLAKLNDLNEVTAKRDMYMEHLRETKNRRFKEFKTGYLTIARKLKELYRSITLGGDADLEFIDSLDPFSEGINYAVRPNKKTWKINIHLSGGEKTLASLALIFALHYYKPSPLYIMDEIDAALDFKNVSIIANYIKKRTRNTQFLIISLRNNMYELADRLIGIYKTYNITKCIPFDPIAFDRKFGINQSCTQLTNTQTTTTTTTATQQSEN
ncbi:structural maintenance of chromosomes 4-like protein gluon [Dermatophagoides pteronyssinus]|uniref:structural maintenance of chromosomes 4-like protein gluon n=1 Tax=Dermatophagoides pteronyssinus TaxID=6956 RepID=UPI003F67CD03